MANFFTNIFRKLKGFVVRFYNENEARMLADAKALAIRAKDIVSNYDLRDPAQRIDAIHVIRDAAERTGAGWGKELFVEGIETGVSKLLNGMDSNIKKFLHFALITEPLIKKYADKIPASIPQRFFALAVELALSEAAKILTVEEK